MDTENNHILIVDDNLKNLQIIGQLLKSEGFMISLAPSGKQALELLNSFLPDLILLDVMMPELDGLEVCRLIKTKERLKDIPIVFLTAKNETEDLIKGFEAGGVDYVTKPFHQRELLIRVKNHLELANSRRKIIEMNKNRDKLYSIIAHDIKSPLSSVIFMVQALRRNLFVPETDDYNEMIDVLEKSTTGTISLLNNLLTWAKMQGEVINLQRKITNLHHVLEDCFLLFKPSADNKEISLTSSVPESFTAYFDEITIHTVFRNIISNAIKFTPKNGKVHVSGYISHGFVSICFKDTGKGIPDDIIHKIMVQNQHHTSYGTENEQGTGLGLVMIKDFVAKNNGRLSIKSKEGEGTEVLVSLPLNKPDEDS